MPRAALPFGFVVLTGAAVCGARVVRRRTQPNATSPHLQEHAEASSPDTHSCEQQLEPCKVLQALQDGQLGIIDRALGHGGSSSNSRPSSALLEAFHADGVFEALCALLPSAEQQLPPRTSSYGTPDCFTPRVQASCWPASTCITAPVPERTNGSTHGLPMPPHHQPQHQPPQQFLTTASATTTTTTITTVRQACRILNALSPSSCGLQHAILRSGCVPRLVSLLRTNRDPATTLHALKTLIRLTGALPEAQGEVLSQPGAIPALTMLLATPPRASPCGYCSAATAPTLVPIPVQLAAAAPQAKGRVGQQALDGGEDGGGEEPSLVAWEVMGCAAWLSAHLGAFPMAQEEMVRAGAVERLVGLMATCSAALERCWAAAEARDGAECEAWADAEAEAELGAGAAPAASGQQVAGEAERDDECRSLASGASSSCGCISSTASGADGSPQLRVSSGSSSSGLCRRGSWSSSAGTPADGDATAATSSGECRTSSCYCECFSCSETYLAVAQYCAMALVNLTSTHVACQLRAAAAGALEALRPLLGSGSARAVRYAAWLLAHVASPHEVKVRAAGPGGSVALQLLEMLLQPLPWQQRRDPDGGRGQDGEAGHLAGIAERDRSSFSRGCSYGDDTDVAEIMALRPYIAMALVNLTCGTTVNKELVSEHMDWRALAAVLHSTLETEPQEGDWQLPAAAAAAAAGSAEEQHAAEVRGLRHAAGSRAGTRYTPVAQRVAAAGSPSDRLELARYCAWLVQHLSTHAASVAAPEAATVIPPLLRLLDAPCPHVRLRVVAAVGGLTLHHARHRQALLAAGGVPRLVSSAASEPHEALLANKLLCLALVVDGDSEAALQGVRAGMLPLLERVVAMDRPGCLSNAAEAIKSLVRGARAAAAAMAVSAADDGGGEAAAVGGDAAAVIAEALAAGDCCGEMYSVGGREWQVEEEEEGGQQGALHRLVAALVQAFLRHHDEPDLCSCLSDALCALAVIGLPGVHAQCCAAFCSVLGELLDSRQVLLRVTRLEQGSH